ASSSLLGNTAFPERPPRLCREGRDLETEDTRLHTSTLRLVYCWPCSRRSPFSPFSGLPGSSVGLCRQAGHRELSLDSPRARASRRACRSGSGVPAVSCASTGAGAAALSVEVVDPLGGCRARCARLRAHVVGTPPPWQALERCGHAQGRP